MLIFCRGVSAAPAPPHVRKPLSAAYGHQSWCARAELDSALVRACETVIMGAQRTRKYCFIQCVCSQRLLTYSCALALMVLASACVCAYFDDIARPPRTCPTPCTTCNESQEQVVEDSYSVLIKHVRFEQFVIGRPPRFVFC